VMFNLEEKCAEWVKVSKKYKEYKAKEAKLREEISNAIFRSAGASKKTVTHNTSNYQVKVKRKINISVMEGVFKTILPDLTEEELSHVKLKPSISKTELKKIPKGSILLEAIIEKPGKSTLKIEGGEDL